MKIDSKLNILVYGHPKLSEKAVPVKKIDGEIKRFGDELIRMMLEYDGVGLAATQLGVKLRMIALCVPSPDPVKLGRPLSPGEELLPRKMPAVIINPRIISFGEELSIREEGCLSVPGIFSEVERPAQIVFEGIVNYEEKITIECAGLLSRAIQHEIDHLDGVLFVDRLGKKAFSKIKSEMDLLKKNSAQNNFIRTVK
ncbi:MAG TPA: peptide deformylase [Victivallales bacterium]|nr:peptide deformylase [Victivallales bacterium]